MASRKDINNTTDQISLRFFVAELSVSQMLYIGSFLCYKSIPWKIFIERDSFGFIDQSVFHFELMLDRLSRHPDRSMIVCALIYDCMCPCILFY